MRMRPHPIIVTIVGLGNVGRSILHELLCQSRWLEINIMDPSDQVSGSLLDLGHASMLNGRARFTINNRSKLADSDFIFHCAGVSIPPGHTREYAMYENLHITYDVFSNYEPYKEDPKIIVLSNPLDILSLCSWKASGLPRGECDRCWYHARQPATGLLPEVGHGRPGRNT